jgi:hypothetical protein
MFRRGARRALYGLMILAAMPAPGWARTFGGFLCPIDCGTHQAGYLWAQANSVSEPAACIGSSAEFIEGCNAYLNDPLRGADYDDDGDAIRGSIYPQ